ncbi:hypothetical protein BGP_2065 [Beggiatoa sp. PS]|nr:hypothetical protein BGP_2065 [Beggiatoa sp. PS]
MKEYMNVFKQAKKHQEEKKMKLICYVRENGEVPFLEYMTKYELLDSDSEKEIEQKVKHILHIKDVLIYLFQHKGSYNLAMTEQYKGKEIGILKITEGKSLIRIGFYTIVGQEIVLLGVYDKPNKYGNKAKGKAINKMIQEALDIFEAYKEDYLKTQKSVSIPFDL